MASQELFRLYSPRIKAMMMRQGADAAASEDIVQEALFIVWRKAHLFAAQKGASHYQDLPKRWLMLQAMTI